MKCFNQFKAPCNLDAGAGDVVDVVDVSDVGGDVVDVSDGGGGGNDVGVNVSDGGYDVVIVDSDVDVVLVDDVDVSGYDVVIVGSDVDVGVSADVDNVVLVGSDVSSDDVVIVGGNVSGDNDVDVGDGSTSLYGGGAEAAKTGLMMKTSRTRFDRFRSSRPIGKSDRR